MEIHSILFDINGTLIDILTDEHHPDIFRKIRNFLSYQGIYIHKMELHDLYFELLKEQKKSSEEKYSEFDAVKLWESILNIKQTYHYRSLPEETRRVLPVILAQIYRAASFQKKLQLYPGVIPVLTELSKQYPMGIVTDAQSAYGVPELRSLGIAHYFNPIIVSGDHGYRKPDTRLFKRALAEMDVEPEKTVFVGNDMYHDVAGAKEVGMKVVFFQSNQGNQTAKEGIEPDYIIRNFNELLNAIEFFRKL